MEARFWLTAVCAHLIEDCHFRKQDFSILRYSATLAILKLNTSDRTATTLSIKDVMIGAKKRYLDIYLENFMKMRH